MTVLPCGGSINREDDVAVCPANDAARRYEAMKGRSQSGYEILQGMGGHGWRKCSTVSSSGYDWTGLCKNCMRKSGIIW